jgi:hypothetical protein
VTLLLLHPHDVLVSKLERMTESDVEHARRILQEFLSLRRSWPSWLLLRPT